VLCDGGRGVLMSGWLGLTRCAETGQRGMPTGERGDCACQDDGPGFPGVLGDWERSGRLLAGGPHGTGAGFS
jgi:hypothetical protein